MDKWTRKSTASTCSIKSTNHIDSAWSPDIDNKENSSPMVHVTSLSDSSTQTSGCILESKLRKPHLNIKHHSTPLYRFTRKKLNEKNKENFSEDSGLDSIRRSLNEVESHVKKAYSFYQASTVFTQRNCNHSDTIGKLMSRLLTPFNSLYQSTNLSDHTYGDSTDTDTKPSVWRPYLD